MIVYITLLAAVGFEVAGTILLPLTRNFSKPLPSLFLQFFFRLSTAFSNTLACFSNREIKQAIEEGLGTSQLYDILWVPQYQN